MAFWNKSPDAHSAAAIDEQLGNSQQQLAQARRRLLGAAILLVLACALIPWMLDSAPRPWGDDVVLRMPKNDQPYQSKPAAAGAANKAMTDTDSKTSDSKPPENKALEIKPPEPKTTQAKP